MRTFRWLPLLDLLVLTGCGQVADSSVTPSPADDPPVVEDGVDVPPPAVGGPVELTLRVSYERAPITAWQGLDYGQLDRWPVRRAAAWVEDAATGERLADATTDDDGRLLVTAPAGATLRVGVRSEVPSYALRVVDNTHDDAVYTLTATVAVPGEAAIIDVVAGLRHDGVKYVDRAAAPFAALDTALQLHDAVAPILGRIDPLDLHWSSRNAPIEGERAHGDIGTTHYDPATGIWLLGAEDIDTDELDPSVIAHEWMHHFEHHHSRTDTKGGPHGGEMKLHAGTAFSEGWATAVGQMVLGSPFYRDSDDAGQRAGWQDDLEENRADGAIGWYGESSVSAILWDLADAAGDGELFDYTLGDLLSVHREGHALTTAIASVHSYGAAFRQRYAARGHEIDALWRREAIAAPVDAWGTGETNDGGQPALLTPSLFPVLGDGAPLTLTGFGPASETRNQLGDHRYVRFTVPADGAWRFFASSDDDIDLRVLDHGEVVCAGILFGGEEECVVEALQGEVLVLELDAAWMTGAADVTVMVKQESP